MDTSERTIGEIVAADHRTVKALGGTVPPSVRLQADQVIV